MYLYSNAARCACNKDSKEFTIQFLQNSPRFNEEGAIMEGADQEILSSVIMPPEYARELAKLILSVLGPEDTAQQ